MLSVFEVLTNKDKKRFFKFPIDLYRTSSYYVPSLISDEMDTFDPNKNGAYSYAESRLWLAERNGKIVGRIGAILNHAANKKNRAKQLRYTRFDFIDDYEVSKALFNTALSWAIELGMTEMIGPLGFTNMDKQGMLIDGFNQMDMYITIYNYPYYVSHMEKLGLTKKWDWDEMIIKVPKTIPDKVERVANIAINRFGYSIKRFHSMIEIKPYIKEAIRVINSAFEKLHGVVPLTDKQISSLSKLVMLVGKPDYTLMVTNVDRQLVGFGFFAPSVSRAMRLSKGRMGIRTIINLIRDLHDNRHIDFYLIGVRPEDQNKGVEALILREGIKNLNKNGAIDTQTGPMLEDNHNIQNGFKNFDYQYHRHRRCYSYIIPEDD